MNADCARALFETVMILGWMYVGYQLGQIWKLLNRIDKGER